MNKSKYGIFGLDDEIPFGKYRGVEMYEVFEKDISYITYCIEENLIELDNEAFQQYESLTEEV